MFADLLLSSQQLSTWLNLIKHCNTSIQFFALTDDARFRPFLKILAMDVASATAAVMSPAHQQLWWSPFGWNSPSSSPLLLQKSVVLFYNHHHHHYYHQHHHHLHQLSLSSDLTTITWTVTTAAEDLFTILEPLLLPLLLKQQPKYISVSTAREEDIRNRASSFNCSFSLFWSALFLPVSFFLSFFSKMP